MSSCLIFTLILLLSSSFSSSASIRNATEESVTLRPQHEIQKLKLIREHLQRINKPAVKTIQVNSHYVYLFSMCKLSSETCVFVYRNITWFLKKNFKNKELINKSWHFFFIYYGNLLLVHFLKLKKKINVWYTSFKLLIQFVFFFIFQNMYISECKIFTFNNTSD